MKSATFSITSRVYSYQALQWAQQFKNVCFLESNDFNSKHSALETVLAVEGEKVFISNGSGSFERLDRFQKENQDRWLFGYLSYNLKNDIENLTTEQSNSLGFDDCYFFVPKTLLSIKGDQVIIQSNNDPKAIHEAIQNIQLHKNSTTFTVPFRKRMSSSEYFQRFARLKEHIQRGDIYEVNFCQEFYAEDVKFDAVGAFMNLIKVSPTPFSTFLRQDDKYILSSSPERFLAKRGKKLISQPIKGTARRGKTVDEDRLIVEELTKSPKEIAENVMIVDLVRNDLTRSAKESTVATEEKLELHTFAQVHQLISTITCDIHPEISSVDAIKNTFPAGSMTGAPKIKAMELCDVHENSMRGIYSGSVGYFSPDGDFDFNVVIRSLLYNESKKYASFHTGGAITIDAIAEKEYEECLIKASGILTAFDTTIADS